MTLFSNKVTFQVCGLGLGHLFKGHSSTHSVCVCVCVKSLQSCPTLCYPMDCSPPGSSVHGIL